MPVNPRQVLPDGASNERRDADHDADDDRNESNDENSMPMDLMMSMMGMMPGMQGMAVPMIMYMMPAMAK